MAIFGVMSCENHEIVHKILSEFTGASTKELFKVWHLLFKKSYTLDTEEAKQRFYNFKANLKLINDNNADEESSYKMGLNQFSDMTNEEFKAVMCQKQVLRSSEFDRLITLLDMAPAPTPAPSTNFLDDDDDDLTKRNLARANIDHTPFFPPIRNQGNCGSCWAFSSAGTIEGNYGLKMKKPTVPLSPQQLVDCDKGNSGCNGGVFAPAFDYIKKYGLQSESSYPYKTAQGTCSFNASSVSVKTTGYSYCSSYSTQPAVKCSVDKFYALLQKGPLAVGVDAGSKSFQAYKSGIFNASCSEDNHAVIAVGYGSEAGKEFWIVRNSWGATWGDKGYVKIAINPANKNSCFVDNEAFLPLF
jgi:C1A family cysteine protease